MTNRFRRGIGRFLGRDEGSILVETLLIVPVITIFAVGIMEFGNLLWQRHQLQTGVRDAARYWARCGPELNCTIERARNIAFYGTPAPQVGVSPVRVPGWTEDSQLTVTPDPNPAPAAATAQSVISVTGEFEYTGLLLALIGVQPVSVSYTHTQRYIGW
jgi:Flp pilus assembly protein TadG